MSEIKRQKRLTWAGLISLASIPITGVFGIYMSAGVFAGKFLRLGFNEKAKKEYDEEIERLKREGNYVPTSKKIIDYTDRALDKTFNYANRALENMSKKADDFFEGNETRRANKREISSYLSENTPDEFYVRYTKKGAKFIDKRKKLKVLLNQSINGCNQIIDYACGYEKKEKNQEYFSNLHEDIRDKYYVKGTRSGAELKRKNIEDRVI